MQNLETFAGLLYILASLAGFFGAYWYGKNTKKFRASEYTAIVAVPVLLIGIYSYFLDIHILYLFLASAVIGTFFEYVIGYTYHGTLGKRLWTYHKYSVGGYTSLLSIPLWGVGGVLFWFISKAVGL